MATTQSRNNRTFIAGGDLSAGQFHFVTLAADGQIDLSGDGAAAAGVLLNAPVAAGDAATVTVQGLTTVTAGATIAVGAAVASNAAGKAITAAVGDVVMGYAREAGVVNQVIQIELIQGGNVVPA